eukprot:GCRY01000199.1.p1 GENE.GCRY01000199.1~~GCRY01000199.1.p1  ORF type:complete len:477 (+),score=113.59 GCRY01000199.1:159-1433(+)
MLAMRSMLSRQLPVLSRQFASLARREKVKELLVKELQEIRDAGTYKEERVITTPQSSQISVLGDPKTKINFCANNYLGLADNKTLIEAGKKAMDSHGLGLASVRFICGTLDIHKELENKISQFHKTEDTILYGSCFDANGAIFETLLTNQDCVLTDKLNHASIIDGIRLRKKGTSMNVYEHMDMGDLESKLKQSQDARLRLIVTDGVFSMDGDIAPLPQICDLADKYNALVMIDECHATGFFGKHGRGTPEYHNVEGRIDIINSTLGKALGGSTGGYTTGVKEVIQVCRQRARPYLFSNAIAPAVAGAGIECFDMLMRDTSLIEKLRSNTKQWREGMTKAGFELWGHQDCPIAPVMVYDEKKSGLFAEKLLEKDIFVISFSFPVVPKGQARIRVQLSAAHTPEQIDYAINAFTEVGKELDILKN